jgi:hypothetical protein
MFATKNFYRSCGSCVALKRQYTRILFMLSSRGTMYRTVKQFKVAGIVCRIQSASVRTEVVGATTQAITRSHRQSVRYLAQQIGASNSNACKICRDDLLFQYKKQLSQPLSEDGIARRHAFATEGLSGCLQWSHGSPMKHTFTGMDALTSEMSDLRPQKIYRCQSNACRELQYGVHYRASKYSIPCPSVVESLLLNDEFVPLL